MKEPNNIEDSIDLSEFEMEAKEGEEAGNNPELLKVEDVQTHVCAKLSIICTKFVLLNAKQEKQALSYDFGTI